MKKQSKLETFQELIMTVLLVFLATGLGGLLVVGAKALIRNWNNIGV
jgi:hypothetical protein